VPSHACTNTPATEFSLHLFRRLFTDYSQPSLLVRAKSRASASQSPRAKPAFLDFSSPPAFLLPRRHRPCGRTTTRLEQVANHSAQSPQLWLVASSVRKTNRCRLGCACNPPVLIREERPRRARLASNGLGCRKGLSGDLPSSRGLKTIDRICLQGRPHPLSKIWGPQTSPD